MCPCVCAHGVHARAHAFRIFFLLFHQATIAAKTNKVWTYRKRSLQRSVSLKSRGWHTVMDRVGRRSGGRRVHFWKVLERKFRKELPFSGGGWKGSSFPTRINHGVLNLRTGHNWTSGICFWLRWRWVIKQRSSRLFRYWTWYIGPVFQGEQ